MSSSIIIENLWKRGYFLLFGLSIESSEKFPIVVGCSMQTKSGEIVDLPARLLLSSGYAMWGQEKADERFAYPLGKRYHGEGGWNGRVIFALYSDETFHHRLADTGRIEWETMNLFGSSLAGMDYQDMDVGRELNTKYNGRQKEIWLSLKEHEPINIWTPYL